MMAAAFEMLWRVLLPAAAVVGMIAAFAPATARAEGPFDVVASFSILGDMVRQVGADRVNVITLADPGSDTHVYQPTPADVRAIANARLIIVNGMSFDGWAERLIEASGYGGCVVTAAAGVPPLEMKEHGGMDPHAWQSLANARIYVRNIVNGLSRADPVGAGAYRANARRYLKEIDDVEAEIRKAIAALPARRRKVITTHDAFGYFSSAYGVQFLSPVGANTKSTATAGRVAQLIRQIKQDNIAAVFAESISDRRLLDQITRETGARIGGVLYADSLSGPDGPAATYLDMMRHNIETLVAALSMRAGSRP